MKNTEHLTPIAQASKPVAWHTGLDIVARQLEGEAGEILYINGEKVPLPDGVSPANWPTHIVVGACHMSIAAGRAYILKHTGLMVGRKDKPKLNADKVYSYQCDPGHGWVSVPLKTLFEIGIADKITSCSYIRGQSAYLEEDCDAGLFINRMKELGFEVKTKYSHTDNSSPIRSYDRYSPKKAAEIIIDKEMEKAHA